VLSTPAMGTLPAKQNSILKTKGKIAKPKSKQLIIFSCLVTPIFLAGLYNISFAFGSFYDDFLKLIYFSIAFAFLCFLIIDLKLKTNFKAYMIVSFILLVICSQFTNFAKQYLKAKTEEQGIVLGEFINRYKTKKGHFPSNLNDDFFLEAPKRSYIGTKFSIYKVYDKTTNDSICYIDFRSFSGDVGRYNLKTKQWHYYE
jgi:hypothetical protein